MRTAIRETKYKTIIFDLDGTLLDTSPGIFGSVRYAEELLKLPSINESKLKKFLGPPPKMMYAEIYGLSEEKAFLAAKAHRKYGMEKAVYQAKKYEGMDDVLKEFHKRGLNIAVATLKKQTIAEKILDVYELSPLIDIIVGMDDAETLTKSETIKKVIESTGSNAVVMIGDSEYDFVGAKDAGVDFIGVTYGFGFSENETYPFVTASEPKYLLSLVLG